MYEASRNLLSCHLAGFAFYEGPEVFGELSIGAALELAAEPENPYDPEAVKVSYQGEKIGYLPSKHTGLIGTALKFGHGNLFEARVNRITPDAHPERQIGLVVRIRDARTTPTSQY